MFEQAPKGVDIFARGPVANLAARIEVPIFAKRRSALRGDELIPRGYAEDALEAGSVPIVEPVEHAIGNAVLVETDPHPGVGENDPDLRREDNSTGGLRVVQTAVTQRVGCQRQSVGAGLEQGQRELPVEMGNKVRTPAFVRREDKSFVGCMSIGAAPNLDEILSVVEATIQGNSC